MNKWLSASSNGKRVFKPLLKPAPGFMKRYRRMVSSASEGAILK